MDLPHAPSAQRANIVLELAKHRSHFVAIATLIQHQLQTEVPAFATLVTPDRTQGPARPAGTITISRRLVAVCVFCVRRDLIRMGSLGKQHACAIRNFTDLALNRWCAIDARSAPSAWRTRRVHFQTVRRVCTTGQACNNGTARFRPAPRLSHSSLRPSQGCATRRTRMLRPVVVHASRGAHTTSVALGAPESMVYISLVSALLGSSSLDAMARDTSQETGREKMRPEPTTS